MIRSFFLITLFLAGSGFNDVKLKKTKVADGITVLLPAEFFPMTPEDLAQRYPSVRKPIAAYTNEERMVDFSVNQSATQWRDGDIEIAKGFIKASISNMFDKVKVHQEDVREINGETFIIFELETRINGDRLGLETTEPAVKYSYLQYLIKNGQMYVFSFHAPLRYIQTWQPIASEVMNSVKIKPKKL
ncbi:MAG: hypothetical protein ACNS60_06855 [Candidatus Cyclobacteriaceae bacterium M2_1C_046]